MYKLLALLLAFALVITLPGLASKPFYSKGEPREALVAQAMLKSGDWILPTRYGDEFATKPPFSHWMMAIASSPVGEVTEFTSRFPSFILSLTTVVVVFLFIRKETSLSLAFLTSMVLLTSIEWHRASITARVDMTLSSFCIIALLSLYSWGQTQNFKLLITAILCISGAILTKGPVGLVLPLGIASLYYIIDGKKFKFTLLTALKVSLPALLIASSWYLAAYWRGGDVFLNTFIEENFSRFQGTMDPGEDPHTHSFFYLLGTIILGTVPWSVFLLLGFITLLIRNLSTLKQINYKNLLPYFLSRPSFDRFSIICIFTYIIFFSIPSSKRSVYLLPIYPFLSYWLAKMSLSIANSSSNLIRYSTYVLSIILILILTLFVFPIFTFFDFSQFTSSPRALANINFYFGVINSISSTWGFISWLSGLLTFSLALFAIFRVSTLSPNGQVLAFATLLGSTLFFSNSALLPKFADAVSPKRWVSQQIKTLDPTIPSYSYKMRNYGLNFYLGGALKVTEEVPTSSDQSYIYVENSKLQQFLADFATYSPTLISTSPNPIEKSSSFINLFKVTKPNS